MEQKAAKKNSFRKPLRVILAVIAVGIVFYYFNKFGCYFLDKKRFSFPIYYSGNNISIREDAYGEGDFGARRRGKRLHLGVDLLAPVGTPVYATKCGLVINAESNRGFGNYVEILHRGGLVTIYAHLSQMDVYQGQRVCQGQRIGKVGKTGNARNRLILPHLHFEVRRYGIPQDPLLYLPTQK